jgi:hypothetical protein
MRYQQSPLTGCKASLFFFSVMLAVSCSKKSIFEKKEDFEIQTVTELPQDVAIPTGVWDRVEGKLGAGASSLPQGPATANGGGGVKGAPKASDGEDNEGASAGATGDIIFAPLRVYLVEKNNGILRQPKIQIDYPLGGGRLDLSAYTSGQIGSFYFGLEIPDNLGLTDLRVFYVSGARSRKIDGEIFGAGCETFFDVSAQFQKEMLKDGLKLNTARNRHISVLAGNFVLTGQKGKQIVVTQLNVTDSKNRQLLCPRFSSYNSKESRNESDSQSDNQSDSSVDPN